MLPSVQSVQGGVGVGVDVGVREMEGKGVQVAKLVELQDSVAGGGVGTAGSIVSASK